MAAVKSSWLFRRMKIRRLQLDCMALALSSFVASGVLFPTFVSEKHISKAA